MLRALGEIALAVEDGVLTLRIRNDGATNGTGSPGRGLANLGDRVESVDGRFTTRRTGAEFELLFGIPGTAGVLTRSRVRRTQDRVSTSVPVRR
jgi:hypothetical protein